MALVFTLTLWLRLVGGDLIGNCSRSQLSAEIPLMISILSLSICNFIAGFSPNFAFLFFFRAMLGMRRRAIVWQWKSWPVRSAVGFIRGVLQGSWGLGFVLSAAAYGLLYN